MSIQPHAPAVLPGKYVERDGIWECVIPDRPCPELLTEEEAARYLRLDAESNDGNHHCTLERYRREELLRGTRVGRWIRYRRIELERFLDRQTEHVKT